MYRTVKNSSFSLMFLILFIVILLVESSFQIISVGIYFIFEKGKIQKKFNLSIK